MRRSGIGLLAFLLPAMLSLAAAAAGDYPIAPTDDDVVVTYKLSEAWGNPGDTGVPVYFSMDTNSAMQAFKFAVTFDGAVLQAESIESLIQMNGEPPDFLWTHIYPYEGPDKPCGFIFASVYDMRGDEWYYPEPGTPSAFMKFTILPDAPVDSEGAVTFVDWVLGDPPVTNDVVCYGQFVEPGQEPSGVKIHGFSNAKVKILGEVGIFMRGDANDDIQVNIADAIFILAYLFRHDVAPVCPDAADANDDGELNIADAVRVLSTLFGSSGSSQIAPPYPLPGQDTTADSLGTCLR